MVKAAKGTRTLALIFKEGVMVAADSRASMGGYICMTSNSHSPSSPLPTASQSVKKINEINHHMLSTRAGGAADCQFCIKCRLHELANKRRISVTGASKLLVKILYSYRGMGLLVGTMISGSDEKGPGLHYVDSEKVGGLRELDSLLDLAHRILLVYWIVEEAAELARRSIYHATFCDGSSGGTASVYNVGPDGWKKLSGDDVVELHYKYYPVEQGMAEVSGA